MLRIQLPFAILFLIVSVLFFAPGQTATAQNVTIPDANLRAAIESALGKNAGEVITRADMATLTTLTAEDAGIIDLTGLEFATNLTRLGLIGNEISDISALQGLVKLTGLWLGWNDISDISALQGLVNLTGLWLIGNDISDISALQGLVNLTGLGLIGNDISDISALQGLVNLTGLDLVGNDISDISALQGLLKLTWLGLDYNEISDISPLQPLVSLTYLGLSENEISDISPLQGLVKLTDLYLSNNPLSDISALQGLVNLTELGLSENEISDISPLQGLVNLIKLRLENNYISDFSPIAGLIDNLEEYRYSPQYVTIVTIPDAGLRIVTIPDAGLRAALESALGKNAGDAITQAEIATITALTAKEAGIIDLTGLEFATNLTELNLRENQISDISPLQGLVKLIELNLSYNQLSDISALQGLVNLTELGLLGNQRSNRISDISPLQGLVELTSLDLYGNRISDISALQGLVKLTGLWLGWNDISDISALQGLVNLTSLGLGPNPLSDISALQGLVELTYLYLGWNEISDISALQGLGKLTALRLSGNQISDISALQGLVELTTLELDSNDISDISPLQGLVELTELLLDKNQLSDISPLQGLVKLTELDLGDNQLSDISALQGLVELTELYLNKNQLSDISPLQGLVKLTTLWLDYNHISDFSPIDGLIPNLEDYRNSNQTIPTPSTVGGISLTSTDITLDKAKYHVFVRDADGAGILTDAVKHTVITGMPLLDEFFSNGGTIELVATTGTYGDAHISEIMWGIDDALAEPQNSHWIELQANKAITINRNWRLVFTDGYVEQETVEISGIEYQVIDRVSNLGLGYWDVPGQSGNTVETNNPARQLISMVREGSKDSDGIWVAKDGTRSGHWAASAHPSINLSGNRIGTPGADKSKRITQADKPSIPASPFKITEIGNGSDDKNDWIEIQNVTNTEQNLKDKVFSIVTGTTASPADTQLFKVDKDVKVPAKAFLLIANTSPEETILARGQDVSAAADDREKTGVQSYYHVESGLKLPDDGEFLLILRSEAKLDKSEKFIDVVATSQEKFIDVVGTHFIEKIDGEFNTEVWPLQVTAKGHDNIIDGTAEEVLQAGYVYTRGKDNAFAEKALAIAGYTGVGYDRDAAKTDANGGTPGYANDVVKENPIASTVSISEIMFDNSRQLPQWIELYNASHTQAVKLNDWTLKIEQSPGDEAVTSRRNVTLKFTGDKIISPNQTLLIVTTRGRSATGHFPETRVINLWNDYREKLDAENRRFTLLSQKAFRLTLASKDKTVVDEVGNYDSTGAAWELPIDIDADERSSLIRRYGTKVEDSGASANDGTLLSSWKLASKSTLNQAQEPTYYGSQDDAGTPGYRAGGALPVSLSSFTATRTDGAIVVEWATASELNNAGFNLLRSSTRTGAFTQVNPQLIAGAGTTGERTTYRYTDTSAKPNTMYYYRIEEVSTGGVRQALETTRLKGYLNAEGKALEPWATLKTEE